MNFILTTATGYPVALTADLRNDGVKSKQVVSIMHGEVRRNPYVGLSEIKDITLINLRSYKLSFCGKLKFGYAMYI